MVSVGLAPSVPVEETQLGGTRWEMREAERGGEVAPTLRGHSHRDSPSR